MIFKKGGDLISPWGGGEGGGGGGVNPTPGTQEWSAPGGSSEAVR